MKGKGDVDEAFWKRIRVLVKHVVPTWHCKEASYIAIQAALLIARTLLSIWLADVNGRVVKAIVNKDLMQFVRRIFVLFLFALPSSTINSAIEFY